MIHGTVFKKDTARGDIVHSTAEKNAETNMRQSTVVNKGDADMIMMCSTVVKKDTTFCDIVHGSS